jgi:predicted DNA-binding protein
VTEVRKQMHQTTVRFDGEMWRRIDAESARIGVSAAQYIRDATLIRLTHEAGARAQVPRGLQEDASAAIAAAGVINLESQAVWAQARQARERARSLRESSRRLSEAHQSPRPWAGGSLVGRAEPGEHP